MSKFAQRFSLRGLFLAFTLLAICLITANFVTHEWRKEWVLRRKLAKMGATAVRLDENDLPAAAFFHPINWRGLASVKRFSTLDLKGANITPEAIECLENLEHVELFIFSLSNIQDEHIARLAEVDGLRSLWLSNTQVTDECIEGLLAAPNLQWVLLTNTKVTQEGFDRLQEAKSELKVFGAPK